MQKLTQECLNYDPETGVFTWKEKQVHHFKDSEKQYWQTKEVKQKAWNKKHSYKIAGNLCGIDNYIDICINYKYYAAHRLAFLYVEGYLPENDIDHINQIRNDNRWSNLRHVSRRCNMQNRSTRKDNTGGINGVHLIKKSKNWQARITIDKKVKTLGTFKNFEDAVRERYEEEINNPNWICSIDSDSKRYLEDNNLL